MSHDPFAGLDEDSSTSSPQPPDHGAQELLAGCLFLWLILGGALACCFLYFGWTQVVQASEHASSLGADDDRRNGTQNLWIGIIGLFVVLAVFVVGRVFLGMARNLSRRHR